MKLKALLLSLSFTASAFAGTVTGTLQGPSGLPVKNATLDFNLRQAGLAVGTGSVVPVTASCYTSVDGSVVGLPNPLASPSTAIDYGSGTLGAGIYYVQYTFYTVGIGETLASPELSIQLTGTGSIIVSPPVSFPANATGIKVYIGAAPGGEQAQGSTAGSTAQYTQSAALATGAAPPVTNTSPCTVTFNDAIIPYSGYNVSLISSSGNAYPGWPQAWQLNGGLSGIVDISNGAPLWNGTVTYPMPILSQPLNHGPQSISGLVNMTGYPLVNVSAIGIGTATPAWAVDAVDGFINTNFGYLYQGTSGDIGQCLVSNGTAFVPGSCGVSPTIFYQHVQGAGALKPQEPFLNFDGTLAVQDNAGSTRTDVGLPATGVTPGSYTNTSLTVDGFGRVTAASSGGGSTTSKVQVIGITTGICTTSTAAYTTCDTPTNSWATAFSDASYAITCSTPLPTGPALTVSLYVKSQTASGFVLTLQNGTGSGAQATTVSSINCIGIHP